VATVAVWQAVEHYREDRGAKFGTYVIHVVNNALMREQAHWSKKKRKALLVSTSPGSDEELAVILVDSGPGPAARADGTQMRHVVREAVDALEPKLKEIVERRYWRDETLQEIGDSWGLSRERIRQLEAKALQQLKPRLAFLWLGSMEAA
jgi:RNA polymerase sigma factor (sigma-70 family)